MYLCVCVIASLPLCAMKFGKSLSNQIEETLPEWQDKFLSYKELKKKLKLLEPRGGVENRPNKRSRSSDPNSTDTDPTKEELDFIRLLEEELDKFNSFFVEKEEEYIIRLKVKNNSSVFFSYDLFPLISKLISFDCVMSLIATASRLLLVI